MQVFLNGLISQLPFTTSSSLKQQSLNLSERFHLLMSTILGQINGNKENGDNITSRSVAICGVIKSF